MGSLVDYPSYAAAHVCIFCMVQHSSLVKVELSMNNDLRLLVSFDCNAVNEFNVISPRCSNFLPVRPVNAVTLKIQYRHQGDWAYPFEISFDIPASVAKFYVPVNPHDCIPEYFYELEGTGGSMQWRRHKDAELVGWIKAALLKVGEGAGLVFTGEDPYRAAEFFRVAFPHTWELIRYGVEAYVEEDITTRKKSLWSNFQQLFTLIRGY